MADTNMAQLWFKAVEGHDEDGAVGLLDPEVVFFTPAGSFTGSEGARPFVGGYIEAFPDATFSIDRYLTSGQSVIAEGTYAGTHTGTMRTPNGDIPATGKSISIPFVTIFDVAGDRITAHRAYWDMMAFLGQLGLIPQS